MIKKNTSISLGEHFDSFISRQLEHGRYASVSEIVREGLRLLENQETERQASSESSDKEYQKR